MAARGAKITDKLFLGDAFSRCTAGYCSPREYRRLFRAG